MASMTRRIAKNIEKPIYSQSQMEGLVEEAGARAFRAALLVINNNYGKMMKKDTRLKTFVELYLQEFKKVNSVDVNDIARDIMNEGVKGR